MKNLAWKSRCGHLFSDAADKVAVSVMVVCLLPTQSALAQECEVIKPRSTGGAVLGHSGRYCVQQDMLVDSAYNPLSHGAPLRGNDRVLMLLAADNIFVDLQQHSLTGNAPLRGAIETPRTDWQNFPDVSALVLPKNLTIRNGSLRLTRRAESAIGVQILSHPDLPVSMDSDLLGRWAKQGGDTNAKISDAKRWAERIRSELPKMASGYIDRHVTIDKMHIRTGDVGIAVEGANTIIRNSTIEVDTGTAIWIYGPNAIIENNIIIVHGDYQLLDADAPIRLHHGDGAIIRNNKIVIGRKAHERVIATFDTGKFSFEGNTMYGLDSTAAIAVPFLGTLQMQDRESRFEPAWKALTIGAIKKREVGSGK